MDLDLHELFCILLQYGDHNKIRSKLEDGIKNIYNTQTIPKKCIVYCDECNNKISLVYVGEKVVDYDSCFVCDGERCNNYLCNRCVIDLKLIISDDNIVNKNSFFEYYRGICNECKDMCVICHKLSTKKCRNCEIGLCDSCIPREVCDDCKGDYCSECKDIIDVKEDNFSQCAFNVNGEFLCFRDSLYHIRCCTKTIEDKYVCKNHTYYCHKCGEKTCGENAILKKEGDYIVNFGYTKPKSYIMLCRNCKKI